LLGIVSRVPEIECSSADAVRFVLRHGLKSFNYGANSTEELDRAKPG